MSETEEIVGGVTSEVWSQGDLYTKLKLMRLLILLDKYQTIALYGTEEMDNGQVILDEQTLNSRRVEALFRVKDTLKILFENTNFGIRLKNRKHYEQLRDRLNLVEGMLDGAFIESNTINFQKRIVINEKWFRKMLSELGNIKEELNVPLNEAGFIFRASDDIDLDELQREIEQSG